MRRLARAVLAVGVAWLAAHHAARTNGSTRYERLHTLPGDQYVQDAQLLITHAVTIAAPPERVWPWLMQVGWHRGGWYTARWVDRLLFPTNWPSADRIVPELQHLDVGDFVPDGPPDSSCGFLVVEKVPNRHLVLQSTSHLPLAWRRLELADVTWTWAFVLRPVEDGTRLVFRWRAHTHPWWLTAAGHLFLLPADLLMSRDMLRGIASRVTRPVSHLAAEEVRTKVPTPAGPR